MKKAEIRFNNGKYLNLSNLDDETVEPINNLLVKQGGCLINYADESWLLNFRNIDYIKFTDQNEIIDENI